MTKKEAEKKPPHDATKPIILIVGLVIAYVLLKVAGYNPERVFNFATDSEKSLDAPAQIEPAQTDSTSPTLE